MRHNETLQHVLRDARTRVEQARKQAGDAPWLLGYDVNGIQEYITANNRPIAMRGASLLIKDFDKDFDDEQRSRGALFAGGGRGLLLVGEPEAKRLLEKLPGDYTEKTVTGVLAVAAVPWSGKDEKASLRWLHLKLQSAKDAARPPGGKLPTSKTRQCQRCQAYEAKHKQRVGQEQETEHVCERCKRITERGQGDGQHGLSLTDFSAGGYVAAISADGNHMGKLFEAVTTVEGAAGLSAAVAWLFTKAHEDALDAAKVEEREYIAPITGGDDLRVFLAPGHVEPYVRTLARVIAAGAASFGDHRDLLHLNEDALALAKQIGVGVGVAVAGEKTSASWMLQRAHDLERSAKKFCLSSGARSAVDFVWVSSGEAYIDGASVRRARDKDQRPLSLDGDRWSTYVDKTRALRDVPASQRAVVAERQTMGKEEFANLFRYQVARSDEWQAWYAKIKSDWRDPARVLEDMPNAGMLDLLRMLDLVRAQEKS